MIHIFTLIKILYAHVILFIKGKQKKYSKKHNVIHINYNDDYNIYVENIVNDDYVNDIECVKINISGMFSNIIDNIDDYFISSKILYE